MSQRKNIEYKQQDISVFDMPGMKNICRNVLPSLVSAKDLVALSLASRTMLGLFKQPLAVHRFHAFQEFVAQRKLDRAIKLLLVYPEYLTAKGNFTDYSGREFQNTSVFEYLLWANDEAAWNTLLDSLPLAVVIEKLAAALLKQFNSVIDNGVTYILNNVRYTEKYYDDSAHINAFKTLILNSNIWSSAGQAIWCMTTLANLQSKVPVFIAQAVCSTKENVCTLAVHQQDDELKMVQWYPLPKAEGVHQFAIVRGEDRAVGTSAPYVTMMEATVALLEDIQLNILMHQRVLKQRLQDYVLSASKQQEDKTVHKGKSKGCVIC